MSDWQAENISGNGSENDVVSGISLQETDASLISEELDATFKAPEKQLSSINQPQRLDAAGLRTYYGGQPFLGYSWYGPNDYQSKVLSKKKRPPLPKDPAELIYELQRLLREVPNHRQTDVDGTNNNAKAQYPGARKILRVLRSLTYYPSQHVLIPEYSRLLGFPHASICRLAHLFVRECAPFDAYNNKSMKTLRSGDENATNSSAILMETYPELIEVLESLATSKSPARRAAATKTLVRVTLARDMLRAADFVGDVFRSIGGAVVGDEKSKSGSGNSKGKKKGFGKKQESQDEQQRAAQNANEASADSSIRAVDDGAGGIVYSSGMETAVRVKSKLGKILVGHAVLAGMRRLLRLNPEGLKVDVIFFDAGLLSINAATVRHTMAILEARVFGGAATAVAQYLLPRLPHKNPPKNKRLIMEDLSAKIYYARILSVLAQDPDLAEYVPNSENREGARGLKTRKTNAMSSLQNDSSDSGANKTGNAEEKKGFFQFIFRGGKKLFGGMKRKLAGMNGALKKPQDPIGVEFVEALLRLLQNPSNRVLLEVLRGVSRRRWMTWTAVPIPQSALFGSPELDEPRELELKDWRKQELGEDSDGGGDGQNDSDDEMNVQDNELFDGAMGGEDGDFFDWDPNAIGDGEENGAGGDEEEELNVVVDEKVIRDGQKKVGFVQRIKEKRRVKRQMNFDLAIPFYMRRVGDGYVTALEVVMRRIHAALFSDESIRRLGAAEAAMHLGRAKLYSDSEEDRMRYQIAKDSMYNQRPKDVTNLDASAGGSNAEASAATSQPKSKKKNQSSLLALAAPPEPDNLKNPSSNAKNSISSGSLLASTNSVNSVQSIQNGGLGFVSGNASQEQNEVNVLEPLVLPLKELMDEDLSMAVRAEAATALVFFIAAGAGLQVFAREVQAERERKFNSTEPEELAQLEYENVYSAAGARKSSCVLVRYFGAFLADSQMGRGTGLVAARRLMDALLYEILEESPWLAIDAVELAEWWAMRHPLPSPTGALGLFWEALLSVGTAEAARAVGASVTRCLLVDPSRERVAVAAAVFLRRRILDIAVLSVDGAAQQLGASGAVFPEPLPAAIGTEVERYMSALWQALVLGPSAETRSACVAALGGGAALAGEPFRIATYERLCEVVRARGYGLRIDSQRVLDGLDSMYHARERLGEARSNAMRMQTGANQNKWLQGVWKLAAQSACAAQVLLGCPPPPGWEPLGPEGSADVINAEARFGNYRLREVRMASGLDDDNLRPIAEYMPQYAYDNLPPPPPPSLSQNNTQNQKPPEISGLKIN